MNKKTFTRPTAIEIDGRSYGIVNRAEDIQRYVLTLIAEGWRIRAVGDWVIIRRSQDAGRVRMPAALFIVYMDEKIMRAANR